MNRLSRRPGVVCRNATFWTVVLAALLQLVPNVPSASAAGTTPSHPGAGYVLDWEDPALTLPPPNWNPQYHPGKVRIASAANGEPVRAGHRSVRFQLDKTDAPVSGGARAEFAATPEEPAGAERWYGFSTYLPTSWTKDQAGDLVTQWHQTDRVDNCDPLCSPPLSIGTRDGQWVISQSWQKYRGNTKDWSFSNTKIGDYQTGRWTDWVVHVKWSTTDAPDAKLEIWKDRQLVWNKPGLRNDDFGDGVHGNYMKFGIYKSPWSNDHPSDTTTRTLHYDELRITDGSGSFQAVSPPGARQSLLRPDGDVMREWTGGTPGAAWSAIDEPVLQPAAPTSDYIWAGEAGRRTEVNLSTTPLSGSATGSKVWFYANTGASTTLTVEALWPGENHSITVGTGAGFAWRSLSISPPDQGAVDGMKLGFTTAGGGDSNVRAAYVELAKR